MARSKKLTKVKVWAVVSKAVRQARPICEVCRVNWSSQVHHIVHRNIGGPLYFDEKNLLAVCYACHNDIDGKGKYDLEDTLKLLIAIIGEERYNYLRAKKNERGHFKQGDLEDVLNRYK